MTPARWLPWIIFWHILMVLLTGCSPSPTFIPQYSETPFYTPTPNEQGMIILGPEDSLRMDAEMYAKEHAIPVDEAIQRLKDQDAIGALNATLLANEPDTFGGLWIEHEPKYKVVVLFTRRGKQTIRPYLKGKSISSIVEVRQARYSMAELEQIYAHTVRELSKLDFEVITFLDVQENRVGVTVSDRRWFESELRRVGAELPKGAELRVVEGGPTARNKDLLLTPPVPGIAFPRQKPAEGLLACPAALMVGRLQQDGACLYVQTLAGDNRILPIWPSDYTLIKEGDQVLVINEKGQVAARVGEEVWMGGGNTGVDEWVLQMIPPACQGDYFLACGGVRPNLTTDSELFAVDIIPGANQTVLFLRYKPALDHQVTNSTMISGRLVAYDYHRCLHLGSETAEWNLIWPTGWSALSEGDSFVILDEMGQVVARLGDEVQLNVRAIPHDAEFPAYQQLINELPGDCLGASWLVDGFE